MRYISLFSGIGVFDLALENVGFECVSVCEIDKDAQKVLRKHFPSATLYDDVRKVGNKTHERGTIDLICGGPPCQDFSVAGKRAGLVGERSGLWFEFARVIDELEPKWVIFENVPGLFSSWSPVTAPPCEMEVRDFDTREEAERWKHEVASDWVVEESNDFETIVSFFQERGYSVAWRVLDSQYFGVPQRRRRVFLVASFGNGSCAEVLFERERVSGDTVQSNEARKVSPTLSSSGAGTSRTGNGNEVEFMITVDTANAGANQNNAKETNVIDTLNSVAVLIPPLRGSGGVIGSPSMNDNLTDIDFLVFDQAQITSPQNRTNMKPGDPSPTLNKEGRVSIFTAGAGAKAGSTGASETVSPSLRAGGGLNMMPSVFIQKKSATVTRKWAKGTGGPAGDEVQNLVVADLAPTLERGYAEKQGGNQQFISQNGDGFPIQNGGIRRLTPLECERLQGLPDNWTATGIDKNGKEVNQADSPRYKQCGNAVTRNPVEWIAKRIWKIEHG